MDLAVVRRWVDGWAQGWASHDVELIGSLYTDDARQRSEPFRDVDAPRRYAEWAFSDEVSAEVWFAEPYAVGEQTAACEWWAISAQEGGATVTLAGVSLLHFTADGRVDEQRDYWSEQPGSQPPPDAWGPIAVHRR